MSEPKAPPTGETKAGTEPKAGENEAGTPDPAAEQPNKGKGLIDPILPGAEVIIPD